MDGEKQLMDPQALPHKERNPLNRSQKYPLPFSVLVSRSTDQVWIKWKVGQTAVDGRNGAF